MANKFVIKNGLVTQNIEMTSPDKTKVIQVDMLNSGTLSVTGNSGSLVSVMDANGGAVGIGIDNPTQKLHVNGNLRVTGGYYDSSNDIGATGYVLSSTGTGTDWKASSVTNTTNSIVERGASREINVSYVNFTAISNGFSTTTGEVWYSIEEDCLNVAMSDGSVLQVGQEFFMPPCKNKSGALIPNGSFVMATGAQGDKITIAKAITDGSIDPMYMIGVATSDIITDSEVGRVTTDGIVRDIDTSAWGIGTLSDQPGGVLYPDPLVPGGLTLTKPEAPAIRTPIAIVLRVNATNGRIYVRMTNGSVLGGTDSNVKFTELKDKDFIAYESATSCWINASLSNNYFGNFSINGNFTANGFVSRQITVTASSATTNLDLSLADNFYVIMKASSTFTVSNLAQKIGSTGNIIIKEDASGGWSFTKAIEMKTPLGGASIVQVTAANSLSVISYYVVDASTMLINYIGNFA